MNDLHVDGINLSIAGLLCSLLVKLWLALCSAPFQDGATNLQVLYINYHIFCEREAFAN